MQNYQLHIRGLVQGVGFRPFVVQMARQAGLRGWVCNGGDGLYVEINATKEEATSFARWLENNAPPGSIISSSTLREVDSLPYSDFSIRPSLENQSIDLLLPPDRAICPECKKELFDPSGRRYRYPFTTCLHCGPRYTLITGLPYDRVSTTMAELDTCRDCREEYTDPLNRRFHSQTQSCPSCPIRLQAWDRTGLLDLQDQQDILAYINSQLKLEKIIALKGTGGYLLLCDARSETAIRHLRNRKQRPSKPFAVLYPDLEAARGDAWINETEAGALESPVAPVVLCRVKDHPESGLAMGEVAPQLSTLGVLLPNSPLLLLVASDFNAPLVATSANLSGSPIIYEDETAIGQLAEIADITITYNRKIVMPADDSVVQFTEDRQPIWLRRARGLAPVYFPSPFGFNGCRLAMGAELKSAFALSVRDKLFISQYLGDQQSWLSQQSFRLTLEHLLELVEARPEIIYTDSHPGYQVTALGREMATGMNAGLEDVPHHLAHFAAVLAEHGATGKHHPVLGFTWDGNGFGEDGQVWGGESFLLEEDGFTRVAHLDYFPQLLGDKMNREPRLSALSMLRQRPEYLQQLRHQFNEQEWHYYEKLVRQEPLLLTSSMGRLLDGIAAILGIQSINQYEGEAALKLESRARASGHKKPDSYWVRLNGSRLEWLPMLEGIIQDQLAGLPLEEIAARVFETLVEMIGLVAERFDVDTLAFSGGVFQNAWLVNRIKSRLADSYQLLFHQRLSPNDECIGFGQLAYAYIQSPESIKTEQPCALQFQEK